MVGMEGGGLGLDVVTLEVFPNLSVCVILFRDVVRWAWWGG